MKIAAPPQFTYPVHAKLEVVEAQVLADVDYTRGGVDCEERLSWVVACYPVPQLTLWKIIIRETSVTKQVGEG